MSTKNFNDFRDFRDVVDKLYKRLIDGGLRSFISSLTVVLFFKIDPILQGGGWAYKTDAAACHGLRAAMTTEPCTGSGGPGEGNRARATGTPLEL
jgi:hypothetical protein